MYIQLYWTECCISGVYKSQLSWFYYLSWWNTKEILFQCKNAPYLKVNQNKFSQIHLDYLTFKYFNFASTWWRLFHRRAVCTTFDIHVFIAYDDGGISFQIFNSLLLFLFCVFSIDDIYLSFMQLNAIAIAECNKYYKYKSDAGTHVSQCLISLAN